MQFELNEECAKLYYDSRFVRKDRSEKLFHILLDRISVILFHCYFMINPVNVTNNCIKAYSNIKFQRLHDTNSVCFYDSVIGIRLQETALGSENTGNHLYYIEQLRKV